MDRRFDMPWDGRLRATTAFFVAAMLGVAVGLPLLALPGAGGEPSAVAGALLGPLAAAVAVALAWALAPRALVIEGGVLRIDRRLRPIELPLADLRAVGPLPRQALSGMLRTMGSGGAFGHSGRYWSGRLGAIRLYATRSDRHVLVDTEGARFVVTPGDPEAFAAALLQAAPRARPAGPVEALAASKRGGGPWKALGLVLGGVALVVGGLLAFSWASAPTSVRLEGSAVVVERAWRAPLRLELLPGAVAPRLLGPEELRGFRRTGGTAFGAMRTGSFTTDALGRFTLYAARRGPMWLLETDRGRVAVVPDDPPAFDEAVRTRQCPAPAPAPPAP